MPLRIALDGIFFSIASTGISHYWIRLLHSIDAYQKKSNSDRVEFTIFIDSDIIDSNLEEIRDFRLIRKSSNRRFILNMSGCENPNQIFTQSILESGIHVDFAMSTFHTVSYEHANIGVIHDFIPEELGVWKKSSPFWMFKQEYLSVIQACAFASNRTYSQLAAYGSGFDASIQKTAVVYPIVDDSITSLYHTDNSEKARYGIISKAIKASRVSIVIPGGSLLQHHKDTKQAINACSEFLKNVKASVVVITGIPNRSHEFMSAVSLARTYKEHGQNVIFQSFSSFRYILELYQMASIVLCPSLMEGFGMPVAEAILMNGNVVARANSGMEEAGGSLTRYFTDSGRDLVQVLSYARSHPKQIDSMERQWHLSKFSACEVAKSFCDFVCDHYYKEFW